MTFLQNYFYRKNCHVIQDGRCLVGSLVNVCFHMFSCPEPEKTSTDEQQTTNNDRKDIIDRKIFLTFV